MAQRYRLLIEYDGRPYAGWQRQKGVPTVQEELETALAGFDLSPGPVSGAGRTDAGVHALGQVAHVDIARPMTAYAVSAAFNAYLKEKAISVLQTEDVPDDFHARFSATSRHYRYVICNRPAPLALDAGLAWHVSRPLDIAAMQQAAAALIGRHDFTTFRAVQCQAKSPIKTLDYLDIQRDGERVIVSTGARSFLHAQVRSMVGALSKVGTGQWPVERIGHILAARDRQQIGLNAPPYGLYLQRVDYSI